jgi:hypothetical protein
MDGQNASGQQRMDGTTNSVFGLVLGDEDTRGTYLKTFCY